MMTIYRSQGGHYVNRDQFLEDRKVSKTRGIKGKVGKVRGNKGKLREKSFRRDVRKHFLSNMSE